MRRLLNRIALGILCPIIGIILIFVFVPACWNGFRSSSWPETEGVITRSELSEQWTRRARRYRAHLEYRFAVSGRSYTNTSYDAFGSLNGKGNSAREAVTSAINEHPLGSRVQVHHHPTDPTRAVLEPGLNFGHHWWQLLMPFVAIGMGAWTWLKPSQE